MFGARLIVEFQRLGARLLHLSTCRGLRLLHLSTCRGFSRHNILPGFAQSRVKGLDIIGLEAGAHLLKSLPIIGDENLILIASLTLLRNLEHPAVFGNVGLWFRCNDCRNVAGDLLQFGKFRP